MKANKESEPARVHRRQPTPYKLVRDETPTKSLRNFEPRSSDIQLSINLNINSLNIVQQGSNKSFLGQKLQ